MGQPVSYDKRLLLYPVYDTPSLRCPLLIGLVFGSRILSCGLVVQDSKANDLDEHLNEIREAALPPRRFRESMSLSNYPQKLRFLRVLNCPDATVRLFSG